jgi:hypothetical protein
MDQKVDEEMSFELMFHDDELFDMLLQPKYRYIYITGDRKVLDKIFVHF